MVAPNNLAHGSPACAPPAPGMFRSRGGALLALAVMACVLLLTAVLCGSLVALAVGTYQWWMK